MLKLKHLEHDQVLMRIRDFYPLRWRGGGRREGRGKEKRVGEEGKGFF